MKWLSCLLASLAVLCINHAALSCEVTEFDQIPVALEICDEIILDSIEVPAGETLKLHLRNGTVVKFRGNTTFGYLNWAGPLVEINGTDVVIQGEDGAILDGQGPLYWDGLGEWGTLKPTFFTIQLHDSIMNNIHVLNNPRHCVLLADSSNVTINGWVIDASSGDAGVSGKDKAGHNTDGFDIWNSTDVVLSNGTVHNQDDCVAVRCGANILVEDMVCYSGHGLSISVGFSNDTYEQNVLQNVLIRNSTLKGGQNGIHIKTHVDGGLGILQNVTYDNIEFQGSTRYGIIIQENYRNQHGTAITHVEPKNNIPIIDLKLKNIIGVVASSAVPIYILCAEDGCFEWEFTNVLVHGNKSSSCNYVPTGFEC